MAKTTLYTLSRDCKPEPMESQTIDKVVFFTDQTGTFTVEEQRKGVVMERKAYHDYELAKILAEWEGKGYTQI